MEHYLLIIIGVVILKILFWSCYFYIRSQRRLQTGTTQPRQVVVAQPMRAGNHPYNDRSAIINHAEPISATGPPPYAEVLKDGSYSPYSQAAGMPQTQGMPPAPVNRAAAFQGSHYNEAGVMPAFSPANVAPGNSCAPGYNPAASQMKTYPPGHWSQPRGGQMPSGQMPSMAAHPHTTVTGPSMAAHPHTTVTGPSMAAHPHTTVTGPSMATHPHTSVTGPSMAAHPHTTVTGPGMAAHPHTSVTGPEQTPSAPYE